jgi:O-antigen/teichoic acid export membrane protein
VYGLARAIAELPAGLAVRLGYLLIFPVISSSKDMPREGLREQVAPLRMKLLTVAALGLSAAVAIADMLIELIYDQRYHEAAWMLPILLLGVWGSVLCSINEATLLGFGKPLYGALANSVKLAYLVVGLPAAFYGFELLGAVIVVATSDLSRYIPIMIGQRRERFAFPLQDAGSTLLLAVLVCIWMLLRWQVGWGTSFDDLPLPASGQAGAAGP